MRRLVPIALAALLTIGLALPVAAAKPDSAKNEPVAFVMSSCGFDVALADTQASGKFFAFPSGRFMSTGGFASTLTNVEHPSISIDVKYHGRLQFVDRPDGTVLITGNGQGLWWFDDPVDAAMYGLDPGIYIFTGHIEVVTDVDQFALAPAQMNVRVRDLCAELAP